MGVEQHGGGVRHSSAILNKNKRSLLLRILIEHVL
jgi:hypothetical protein